LRTLIAIPVFNEEKYVAPVLTEVRKYAKEILVIDDGSTDQTPLLLARQPVDVIRHAKNRGYGRSLIDAFRWASCNTCRNDWLITMDCDEQHEPASLPDFFAAIEKDDADIISGSRYFTTPVAAGVNGNNGNGSLGEAIGSPPPDRRAINATITEMINQSLGLALTDSFCGYKAYRVSALRRLTLDEPGYAFPLQFWVQAAAQGLRIKEIPIRLIYNDPNRSFGGPLNDAEHRLAHYKSVFERELAKFPGRFESAVAVK
jgi:glycosyltransferase involved in cell wall biosynthesis